MADGKSYGRKRLAGVSPNADGSTSIRQWPTISVSKADSHSYSTRMRVALALARGKASARGASDLTPVHVSLALLREGENSAVAALHHAEVPLNKVRRDLEVALGECSLPREEEVAIPLTDGERLLVQEARNQSQLRGDAHIGPHHLLLAVLSDTDSSASQVFVRYGLTYEAALKHLAAVIVTHDDSGPHGHAV